MTNYRVRRATLDDLASLKALWTSMHFAADDLEKRLTEFQVVEGADGQLVGAIGVQIARPHALLHSESYRDFSAADQVRPQLFQRIQSLASNHGVFRLWTRERAPFWTHHGFQPADADALKKLPEAWAGSGTEWLTLRLKDEDALVSVEKELKMMLDAEKQRTAQTLDKARVLKKIATLVALVLAFFILIAAFILWRKNAGSFQR